MKVRAANPTDAEAIGEIRVAAWRAAYSDFMPAEFLAALDPAQGVAGLRATLSATEPRFHLRVAEVDRSVVAYVLFGSPRYQARPGTFELWALNIHPAHWRRGIGRALVDEALSAARAGTFARMELWCIAGNLPAVSLYESTGFVRTGERRETTTLTGHPLHELAYARAP